MECEIVSQVPHDSLVSHLVRVIEAEGWRVGVEGATPHRLILSSSSRLRSPSYLLAGPALFWDQDWASRLAALDPRPLVYNGLNLIEWTAGKATIELDEEQNGHFRGTEWCDIRNGSARPAGLPGDFARFLSDGGDPRGQLLTALFGARSAEAVHVAVLHRAVDTSFLAALAPVFAPQRQTLLERGRASIQGLTRFQRREFVGGDSCIHGIPEDPLKKAVNGNCEISLSERSLPSGLSRPQIAAAQQALRLACTRIRDGNVDVLLADGLVVGAVNYPGLESRNPKTGDIVRLQAQRRPYFVSDW